MATEDTIQEIQTLEQNLQNTLMQKQAFEIELSETKSSLDEIKNSKDEVYKLIGQVMIRAEKKKIQEELENKNKIIELRVKAIQKQENFLREKLEKMKEGFLKDRKSNS